MKKIGKILALALVLTLVLSLAACSNSAGQGSQNPESQAPAGTQPAGDNSAAPAGDPVTLKVGASPTPHAEILEVAKEILAGQNITLEIVKYDDYNLPNDNVEDGQLDANYFQHITYMNGYNRDVGTHLVSVAELHYEPFGIYAGKTASLADLPDGATIAIPNDPTNGGRALLLLQEQGLVTLADGVGLEPTVSDITDNPHNYKITELTANLLTTTLQDVDIAVINGNYAIGAGLKASEALAIESADGTAGTAYVNVLAVKEGRESDAAIQALVNALKSDQVKAFMDETYGGGVVAVF